MSLNQQSHPRESTIDVHLFLILVVCCLRIQKFNLKLEIILVAQFLWTVGGKGWRRKITSSSAINILRWVNVCTQNFVINFKRFLFCCYKIPRNKLLLDVVVGGWVLLGDEESS